MSKEFLVVLDVLHQHQYTVDAHTPEEAVSVAENWLADDEYGDDTIGDTECAEAVEILEGEEV